MTKLIRTAALLTFCSPVVYAGTIDINFDNLPPIRLSVTLDDGTRISETPDGTFQIVAPDGSESTIPIGLLPDGILPAEGEVPIASELPDAISLHVAFSTDEGADLYYFSGSAAVGSSEPNNITAAVDPRAFPYSANLYANFTSPVNGLTFSVSSDNDEGKIAEVVVDYGSAEQAIVPIIGNADPTDAILVDLNEYANISSIGVINITDTYGLSYDDFSFVAASVPEPHGGTWLVVTALGMLCYARRVRQ